MSPSLPKAIRRLLMEDGRVCLPGIGTLIVAQQPATLSLMEGKAVPPSARVGFNGNLVVDDGRLQQELSDHGSLEEILQPLRHRLAGGQVVALEGIGKLYRQSGSDEIRFTTAGDNLSKESFGLPAVTIKPIVRKERAPAASKKSGRRERPKTPSMAVTTVDHNDRRRRALTYGLFALVAVTVVVLLLLLPGRGRKSTPPTAENTTTTRRATGSAPAVDASAVRPEEPPRLGSRTAALPEEGAPAAPPTNTAIIAIGLYGRQRNVDKQTGRLREAGYEPYTDREGRNTRVGVRVTYTEAAELQRVLAELRQRYTEEAFVMRVNGEERRPQ